MLNILLSELISKLLNLGIIFIILLLYFFNVLGLIDCKFLFKLNKNCFVLFMYVGIWVIKLVKLFIMDGIVNNIKEISIIMSIL